MSETPQIDRPDMPADYGLKPIKNAADLLSWQWAEERLTASRNYWVSTVDGNGRPHTTPVWGLWYEGAFYFGTSMQSQKARNLAVNPAIVVNLESGDEVVILEGTAVVITEAGLVTQLNDAYQEKYNIKALQEGGVYCLRPEKALAWYESDFPWTATRWRF